MTSKLRELRLEKGLSQKELADKISTSNKTIWAYENGVAIPPLDMLIKLADFFGCSIDFLAGRENDFGIVNVVSQDAKTTLSPDEEKLLKYYRQLGPFGRETVLAQTKAILEIEEKNVSSLEKNKV